MSASSEPRGSSVLEPANKVGRGDRGASAVSAAWLAIAFVGFAGFALLAWLVVSKVTIFFDQPLLDLARGWNGLADLWNALSIAAYLPLAALAVGFILWLFVNHRRREALMVIVLLVAVTAGSELVKELVARPRPPDTNTVVPGVVYSFPSGHELESVTILGIFALATWRSSLALVVRSAVGLTAVVLVALVAVGRVSLDAHYPSDVLAGFLGGLSFLAIYALLSSPRPADEPTAVT
jgi:undecaprenyl-diphosphatase